MKTPDAPRRGMALTILLVLMFPMTALLYSAGIAAGQSSTDIESEISYQFTAPLTGSNSGQQQTCTVTLTAGKTYFLYGGTNAAFGNRWTVSISGGATLFELLDTGALTVGAGASSATLVRMSNTSETYNPFYAVVKVTVATTGNYRYETESGGFGSPGSLSQGWNGPAGDITGNLLNVLGYAGTFKGVGGGCPTGANTIGYAIECCPSIQSETAILTAQTDKDPVSSSFLWTRLNVPENLFSTSTSGGATQNTPIAQSFVADASKGKYVENMTFRAEWGSACAGTLWIAFTTTLSDPWSTLAERANITVSYSTSGAASSPGTFTVDFVRGTVTASVGSGSAGLGTPTYHIGGNPITDVGQLPPPFTPADGTVYVKLHQSNNCLLFQSLTSSEYSGGQLFTLSGGVWTGDATRDLKGASISFYGDKTYEHKLNMTQANIGGSIYTYVAMHTMDSDSNLIPRPVSSWGGFPLFENGLFSAAGGAGSATCNFVLVTNKACSMLEYRLGYVNIPMNSSTTLTVTTNTSASGRNLVYSGSLVNQPAAKPNVAAVVFDNQVSASGTGDMVSYFLFSSDDYKYNLYVTVKACATASESGCEVVGDAIPNGSYVAVIRGFRNVAGPWNSTGQFTLSGQDLGNGVTVVDLSALNYQNEEVSITMPNTPGDYTVELIMYPSGASGVIVGTSGVVVTIEGNHTRVVPNMVNLSVNRTRAIDLYYDCVKVDPASGSVRSACTVTEWTSASSNSINFLYPQSIRNVTNSGDVGTYIVFVLNSTGYWYDYQAFCIQSSWSADCSATVGDDLKIQLATDTLNELTAAQRALADAKATVSETSVRQHYLDMLDFAMAPFADCSGTVVEGASDDPACNIPNVTWWYLGTLIVAAVGVARRGRGG